MNKKKRLRFTLRKNLVFIIIVEFAAIIFIAWLFAWLLNHFNIIVSVPQIVWLLVVGMALAAAATILISKWIFAPISRLGKAMDQVTKGDFTVRLETDYKLREIQEINTNFNLMATELGATETLQTDFVSNVSHEFKTPINAIEGYATLLQASDLPPEVQKQYIEKILLNTTRLSKLMGNVLLLSKVDNQAIQDKPTSFRLDEQIRQSIVSLEAQWEKNDIEFDVDMENIEFTGHETLLSHVWTNLIGNAVKFSPKGGEIKIRLAVSSNEVLFTVQDQGPGIPEDSLKHIFNKFYQIDSSHKQEGNGLGLALVHQIVEISNGRVWAENPVGGGCLFSVSLPM